MRAFTVDAPGTYSISTAGDGFIGVYSQPYDTTAPAANCLSVDTAMTVPLNAGTYWLYLSTGNPSTFGTYPLTISGPGEIAFPTAATSTDVVLSPNPSILGQEVAISVSITGNHLGVTPTGTVTLSAGGVNIGTVALIDGVATGAFRPSVAGAFLISATYSGDALHDPSSGSQIATVGLSPTTTALSASPASVTVGAATTLIAVVNGYSPSGTVEFFAGGVSLGSAAVSGGSATLPFTPSAAGPIALSADYSGDANNTVSNGSASMTADAVVATVALVASPASVVVGSPVSLTATVAGLAPSGTVEFFVDGVSLGTEPLLAGEASLSFTPSSAASLSLTAVYSGDGANAVATSDASTVVVTAAPVVAPAATLPVTGADAGPLAIAGSALLLLGGLLLAVRRRVA